MKYSLEWMERKTTSTGKMKIDATLKDEVGTTIDKVTVWDNFPGFMQLAPGHSVEGEVTQKQNGQYLNRTLNAPRTQSQAAKSNYMSAQKTEQISAAQAQKATYIEKAQDRKNESIAFFNATNSAIQIVSKIQGSTEQEYQSDLIRWRNWFLEEWKKYEAGDMEDKHNAF